MSASVEQGARAVLPARYARNDRMLLAGLTDRFAVAECSRALPRLWGRFAIHMGRVAGQTGDTAYGVRYNTDRPGEIEYLCAVEVTEFSSIPRNFTLLCIPVQQCAIFRPASIAVLPQTWTAIRDSWLPGSGYEPVGTQFERYGPTFDPLTANGEFEVWIPVASKLRPGLRKDSTGMKLGRETGWTNGWTAATDR